MKKTESIQEALYEKACELEKEGKREEAFELFRQAAEQEHIDAIDRFDELRKEGKI